MAEMIGGYRRRQSIGKQTGIRCAEGTTQSGHKTGQKLGKIDEDSQRLRSLYGAKFSICITKITAQNKLPEY